MNTVIVRNDASETIPGFGLMRITGVSVDDTGQWFYTVDKPSTSFETWYLVNGPTSIQQGMKAFVVQKNPLYALCDTSVTPAYNQYWGAKSGEWKLFPNRDGFQIQGAKPSLPSDAAPRVLVRQHKITKFIGKLGGDISAGSTASVTIWLGAGGSEAAGEYSVTIQDWMIPSGDVIADGTKIIGMLINGIWYLTEVGTCPIPSS